MIASLPVQKVAKKAVNSSKARILNFQRSATSSSSRGVDQARLIKVLMSDDVKDKESAKDKSSTEVDSVTKYLDCVESFRDACMNDKSWGYAVSSFQPIDFTRC